MKANPTKLKKRYAILIAQGLSYLLFDDMQRIERGHRFLEDHGNVIASDPLEGFLVGID